jgi:hypothetical protein
MFLFLYILFSFVSAFSLPTSPPPLAANLIRQIGFYLGRKHREIDVVDASARSFS